MAMETPMSWYWVCPTNCGISMHLKHPQTMFSSIDIRQFSPSDLLKVITPSGGCRVNPPRPSSTAAQTPLVEWVLRESWKSPAQAIRILFSVSGAGQIRERSQLLDFIRTINSWTPLKSMTICQLHKLAQTCINTLIPLAPLKDAGRTLTAPRVGAKHPHKTLRRCVLQTSNGATAFSEDGTGHSGTAVVIHLDGL